MLKVVNVYFCDLGHAQAVSYLGVCQRPTLCKVVIIRPVAAMHLYVIVKTKPKLVQCV